MRVRMNLLKRRLPHLSEGNKKKKKEHIPRFWLKYHVKMADSFGNASGKFKFLVSEWQKKKKKTWVNFGDP